MRWLIVLFFFCNSAAAETVVLGLSQNKVSITCLLYTSDAADE